MITEFQNQIDHDSGIPKFQQVANLIRMNIESGVIQENSKLPSITKLSASCLISRITVERAYRQLKKQGYISHAAGKGFFVEKRDTQYQIIHLVINKLSCN